MDAAWEKEAHKSVTLCWWRNRWREYSPHELVRFFSRWVETAGEKFAYAWLYSLLSRIEWVWMNQMMIMPQMIRRNSFRTHYCQMRWLTYHSWHGRMRDDWLMLWDRRENLSTEENVRAMARWWVLARVNDVRPTAPTPILLSPRRGNHPKREGAEGTGVT